MDSLASGLVLSSNGKFAIDDPSSPYYFHHSDSPGLSLVSQPLIDNNYASWSQAMMIDLSVKNKLGFIDGSILTCPYLIHGLNTSML